MHRRLLSLLLLTTPLASQDWPAFRGPSGDGIAPVQSAPLSWDQETNIKWQTPLDQAGNGSPIVSNGRVFLTMPEDEEGKRRSLICLDRRDGMPIWVRTVDFGKGHADPRHQSSLQQHASCRRGAGRRLARIRGPALLRLRGRTALVPDLGEFTHQWGMGTSPILHAGKVILNTGPGPESFVAAFDLETGETLWKTVEPSLLTAEQIEKKRLVGTWSTPLVHRVGDRDLVICGQPTRIVAYDANTGEIVWYCKGLTCDRGDLVYSSPVIVGDVCMVMGGYVGPSIGVRMDGEGDVSESHLVWYNKDEMSNCGSGVAVDGHVYIPEMDGWLRCIDGTSGETMWRERIGRGQTWGSIVLVDGLLFMTNQRGTTLSSSRTRRVWRSWRRMRTGRSRTRRRPLRMGRSCCGRRRVCIACRFPNELMRTFLLLTSLGPALLLQSCSSTAGDAIDSSWFKEAEAEHIDTSAWFPQADQILEGFRSESR